MANGSFYGMPQRDIERDNRIRLHRHRRYTEASATDCRCYGRCVSGRRRPARLSLDSIGGRLQTLEYAVRQILRKIGRQ